MSDTGGFERIGPVEAPPPATGGFERVPQSAKPGLVESITSALGRAGEAALRGNVLGLPGPSAIERATKLREERPYHPGIGMAEMMPKDPLANPMVMAFAPGNLAGRVGEAVGVAAPKAAAPGEAITSRFYKGVKPGGQPLTAPERTAFEGNIKQAVDRIVEVKGGKDLPSSPREFSEAVASTKSSTYSEYSGMMAEAEKQGARVPLQPAAARLRKLAADPLQDPAATAEANRLLSLIPAGQNPSVAPARADEIVRFLSERASGLEQVGTKGDVFREAANALRGELITTVEGAGFPRFGELRRAYGSLTEIEDHVSRATGRDLTRGGPQIGLTEIGAAGLAGAGHIPAAAAAEGSKLLSRWWQSPSREIRKMFEEAAAQRGQVSGAPKAARQLKDQIRKAREAAPAIVSRATAGAGVDEKQ